MHPHKRNMSPTRPSFYATTLSSSATSSSRPSSVAGIESNAEPISVSQLLFARRRTRTLSAEPEYSPWFSNFGNAPPASRKSRLHAWREARRRSTEMASTRRRSSSTTSDSVFARVLPRFSSAEGPRDRSYAVLSCFGLQEQQKHATSAMPTAHIDESAKPLL